MKRQGLTRRAFLGGALALPAIHSARSDCKTPAIRIRVSQDFRTFDPADASGEDTIISRNLLAPLVRYKRDQGGDWGWERHIVESITKIDDQRYKFNLRDEGWVGSTSVSAEDVAFSFERIAGLSGGITDAENKSAWSTLETVDIVDQRSATIKLNSKKPDLLSTILPGIAGCVVNKSFVTGLSGGRFTLDPGPTSGRYALCGVKPGISASLSRDDNWKGDKVEIESAIFKVIQDDNAAKELWLAKEIDVCRPDMDVLKEVTKQGIPVVRTPTSSTSFLVLSQQGTLANPELRRAIQFAVNRTAAAAEVYGDENANVATGLISRGWPAWSKEQLTPFNPDEARQLVMGKGPVETLRIVGSQNPVSRAIAARVKRDLDEIGLRSEVVAEPNHWFAIANNTADILVAFTPPQTLGMEATFQPFTSRSGLEWNHTAKFDSLFVAALATQNLAFVVEMQRLLTQDGVIVPILDDQAIYLVSENFRPDFDPEGGIGDLGSWGLQ